MSENNFKRYMGDVEERSEVPNGLRAKVNATTGFFSFAGNIAEVFLPKIIDLLIVITGGTLKNQDKPKSRKTPDNGYDNPRNSPK